MIPKVDKADTVGKIDDIEEYLRPCHGVEKAPLNYIAKKNHYLPRSETQLRITR